MISTILHAVFRSGGARLPTMDLSPGRRLRILPNDHRGASLTLVFLSWLRVLSVRPMLFGSGLTHIFCNVLPALMRWLGGSSFSGSEAGLLLSFTSFSRAQVGGDGVIFRDVNRVPIPHAAPVSYSRCICCDHLQALFAGVGGLLTTTGPFDRPLPPVFSDSSCSICMKFSRSEWRGNSGWAKAEAAESSSSRVLARAQFFAVRQAVLFLSGFGASWIPAAVLLFGQSVRHCCYFSQFYAFLSFLLFLKYIFSSQLPDCAMYLHFFYGRHGHVSTRPISPRISSW